MSNTVIGCYDVYGIIDDSYTLGESIHKRKENVRGPQGYVKIFSSEDGQTFTQHGEDFNIVVYQGREFVAQKIVEVNSGAKAAWSDKISWFGIGSGGAPLSHPLQPTSPQAVDIELASPVMINSDDLMLADNKSAIGDQPAGRYKHPFESVTFAQDTENNDKNLIIKITTTIGKNDANGNGTQYLHEAGLYTSTSSDPSSATNFNLFSRITFPTFVKDNTRSLVFIWYIYL